MRNFLLMLPEDKKQGVTADFDHIKATVQGFTIGLKVQDRIPYSTLVLQDDDAPFHFTISFHFDDAPQPGYTDFHIDVSADLNLVMRKMVGGKIQEALDKIADSLSMQ